ncbi:uncharacterized protein A1O5_11202 [Cladophialophora psammophila CBS 110553]|uniref:Uncharacterized protein n=1 Tax=Cladophialophora psammophila CBS 110553 TaxID=1182543 RepID=W9WL05_9EURO|nr:uncharacterized protein A1O5_11202 [Cladophialophora psammophila CBS 110553]EXJ65675.1 hypothetical protein A1O5_11202 [Cladophialophora psammophila CBS 110553]
MNRQPTTASRCTTTRPTRLAKLEVDQSAASSDHLEMSTFGPAAPAPRIGNAQVFFHLGHTGLEVVPKPFPACVSPGKGVIVREGHLHGPWTCVRQPYHSDIERFCHEDNDGDKIPRTVTFPAEPSAGIPEHKIRIVGSRVIEFSVLEAVVEPARFVRLKVKALIAAANDEFCPTGDTVGVPIWIGVDEGGPENIFRAVHGTHGDGPWEVRCDGGAVVRF